MSLEYRLDQVVDRDSFLAFVDGLRAEREEAEIESRATGPSRSSLECVSAHLAFAGSHHRGYA